MKSKRIVLILTAVLSSFASSLAAGGNVNSKSGKSQSGTSKSSASPEGNQKMKSGGDKKFLGKKRARNRDDGLASSKGRAPGREKFAKENGELDKKLGPKSVPKDFNKNRAPVSSNQVSPVKKTLIPHVPDPATCAVGAIVGTGILGTVAETIANEGFHRSGIDKLRFGTTVQGVIDYLTTPGNLQIVAKKVNSSGVCLLQVKLTDNRYMYVSTYVQGSILYKSLFRQDIDGILVGDLYPFEGRLEKLVDCNDKEISDFSQNNSDGEAVIEMLISGLLDLCRGYYDVGTTRGSIFEGVEFSKRGCEYIKSVIKPYIKKLFNDASDKDLKILKFKYILPPSLHVV